MAETIKIGGELESIATGKVVAAASAIKDKVKNKYQGEINAETDASLADRYTKAETNAQINAKQYEIGAVEIDDVPRENSEHLVRSGAIYKAYSNQVYLSEEGTTEPASFDPQADTLHKGSQVLSDAEKKQARANLGFGDGDFDETPTPGSERVVKSGDVFNSVISSGAFDLSAHTGDTYADLSAALTAMNALSSAYKKGGMSIKFAQSSDNKYVQYRLMADSFNTTPANWQGVDDIPTAGSDNLVKSGGVYSSEFDILAYFIPSTELIQGSYWGTSLIVNSQRLSSNVLYKIPDNRKIILNAHNEKVTQYRLILFSDQSGDNAHLVSGSIDIYKKIGVFDLTSYTTAKYFRISIFYSEDVTPESEGGKIGISMKEFYDDRNKLYNLEDDVEGLESVTSKVGTIVLSTNELIQGSYYGNTLSTDTKRLSCDKYLIIPEDKIIDIYSRNTELMPNSFRLILYDKDYNYITNSGIAEPTAGPFNVSSYTNAVYYKFSCFGTQDVTPEQADGLFRASNKEFYTGIYPNTNLQNEISSISHFGIIASSISIPLAFNTTAHTCTIPASSKLFIKNRSEVAISSAIILDLTKSYDNYSIYNYSYIIYDMSNSSFKVVDIDHQPAYSPNYVLIAVLTGLSGASGSTSVKKVETLSFYSIDGIDQNTFFNAFKTGGRIDSLENKVDSLDLGMDNIAPQYEILTPPNNGWSDFIFITINGVLEIWFFSPCLRSESDHRTWADISRVKASDMTLIDTMQHNFGHANSVQYDAERDILISAETHYVEYTLAQMQSATGEVEPAQVKYIGETTADYTNGHFYWRTKVDNVWQWVDITSDFDDSYREPVYIFYNVSDWVNISSKQVDFNSVSRTIVDVYSVGLGLHKDAVFVENNMSKRNLIYIINQVNGQYAKLLLGIGTSQLESGTYNSEYSGSDEYNGTFKVLKSFRIDTLDSWGATKKISQGMDYANGRIYASTGHDGMLALIHTETEDNMKLTKIEMQTYGDDGTVLSSMSEGICVYDGYVYLGNIGNTSRLVKFKLVN